MSEPKKVRAALYARYSSDLQNEHSIKDQLQSCTDFATSKNWDIVNCYSDAGISGASLRRPGIQMLLRDARDSKFNVVIAEAIDRLSRDQEDIAGIYKRLEFTGIKIVTLSEGEISTLHIGLKGTMNAMHLKDLADKTRRGMRGKVKNGKSGGGLAYGYRVVRQFDALGEAIRGDRSIDEGQAQIVRRIFHEYAHLNRSPKTIAHGLNQDGIAGPSRKPWGQNTMNGNRKRGTGILNNELYAGELVWNRQKFIKDPSTGRRVPRYNPESEWIRRDVPELRIVPQDLWNAAKARQKNSQKRIGKQWKCRRPRYLLSGLIKCGVCGGGYSKISKTHYGCSTARNKGQSVCANRKTIKRETLERAVLTVLKTPLSHDDLVKPFSEEYTQRMNELRHADISALDVCKAEKDKLTKERKNILEAIRGGISVSLIKDELERVTVRIRELDDQLLRERENNRPSPNPVLDERYWRVVATLDEYLSRGDNRAESAEYLGGLIDRIVLTPMGERDEMQAVLYGDLVGILALAGDSEHQNRDRPSVLSIDNTLEPDRI